MPGKPSKPSKLDKHPRGPAWWRELADAQGSDAFVIAFSGGKDSVACALALRDAGYDLHPVAYTEIPGMSFVDETLDTYERTLFGGRHIVRVMHPSFCKSILLGHYQPPHRLPLTEAMGFDYADVDVQAMLIGEQGLPEGTMTAIGVRAADNILRRKIIAVNGPVAARKGQFYAIWDWTIDRTATTISRSGVKLPPDYRLWPHSFAFGSDFFLGVRQHFPGDWARLLEWFPLAEAEVFRHAMQMNAIERTR